MRSEGTLRIELLHESKAFWLNQNKLAGPSGVDARTVSYYLAETYLAGELLEVRTFRKGWRVRADCIGRSGGQFGGRNGLPIFAVTDHVNSRGIQPAPSP